MFARRAIVHGAIVVILTFLTQIGGVVWLAALFWPQRNLLDGASPAATRRRGSFILTAFTGAFLYVFASGMIEISNASGGRVPLTKCSFFGKQIETLRRQPTSQGEAYVAPATSLLCFLNRHFVTPTVRDLVLDVGLRMNAPVQGETGFLARSEPIVLQYLDANFPFFDGFPLLPHLSHHDGRKVDLAFFYKDEDGKPTGPPSFIGYWGFEEPRPSDPQPCTGRNDLMTMRWDMKWFPVRGNVFLDEERTARLIRLLAADPRVVKILLEPHLVKRLGVTHPKVRFQGCRAARHDDHIHVEVAR